MRFLRARDALTEGGYSLGYSSDAFHHYIERAIAADPECAAAYAYRAFGQLSRTLDALQAARLGPGRGPVPEAVENELAIVRRDAERALELDPDLGRAYALASAVDALTGETAAERERFARAVELSGNDAEILAFVTGFYLREGRRAEALDLLDRIRRLNPIDHDVGYFFYLAGDRRPATGDRPRRSSSVCWRSTLRSSPPTPTWDTRWRSMAAPRKRRPSSASPRSSRSLTQCRRPSRRVPCRRWRTPIR
jgi:tetratricopeptide (TPR) repeat protein